MIVISGAVVKLFDKLNNNKIAELEKII